MTNSTPLTIDPTENFPKLTKAPAIEAVVEIRARSQVPWEETHLREAIKERLPEYPTIQSHHEIHGEVVFAPDQAPQPTVRQGWKGVRCESADRIHVAQFNRDGFLFTRLKPYDQWDNFREEALRLWHVYWDLARPVEAQRLGLRFINRIVMALPSFRVEEYLVGTPPVPRDLDSLPSGGFFYQDNFVLPERYGINIVRTVQPSHGIESVALILDIDTYTLHPFEPHAGAVEQRLADLRWLKNKAFFGSITPKLLEQLQ